MALVDSALSSAMQAIDAAALAAAKSGSPWTSAHYWDQVSSALDTQTKTAIVTVSSVSGVTTGAGVSGPGSGTLS